MRGFFGRSILPIAALALVAVVGCGLFHRGGSSEPPARVDLNRASVRAVEKLPGVTPSMAARIVAGRPYADADALVERGVLTRRELERIEDRIVVHGDDSAR